MANATLPPQTPEEQDERYNVANDLYEAEFNSGTMSDAEKQRLRDIHQTDQMEAAEKDPTKAVREGENADPSNVMNYENEGKRRKPSLTDDARSNSPSIRRIIRLTKGFGPYGFILGVLTAVIGLFGLFSPLVITDVYQSLLKFDSNNTSYTIRADKMITNKLTDRSTEGDCDFTKILCRYRRPSNYMLKNMETKGIIALDKAGNKIVSNGIWPNKRPASYTFINPDGSVSDPVAAKNIKSVLNSNAKYRGDFHTALNTRLQTFSDSIFKGIAAKFGFTKKDILADAKSEDDVNKKINEQANGSDLELDENGKPKNSKTKEEINGQAADEIGKEVDKIKSSGSGVGLVAGGVCLAMDGPGIITRTARAYQLAQLIRFGALFMTVASAMKAGDATPAETAAIGGALTAVYAGKSALDSFGMKYTLYGDTSPASGSKYKDYVPGGKVSDILGPITAVFDSDAKKNICAGAVSPVTGLVIDAAISETVVGPLVNAAVGVAGGLAFSAIATNLLPKILDLIPNDFYETLGKEAFGDITADLQGQNYGDALASGAANMLGQLSNAGGNAPLSVEDAVAYDQKTQQVNVAYAQEDRATLSPLDASNKNTFMGSIVNSLIPLYTQTGSFASVLSGVGSIMGSTTSSILFGNAYAATNTESKQYELCNDPTLTNAAGKKIAAGPFCNIQYGIPPQYLDMDPQQVVQDLIDAKQIDEDSGEAKPDGPVVEAADTIGQTLGLPQGSSITSYSDWLKTCTDGTSDQAVNCEITDKLTAEYALYTIDHRIEKNVDNLDTDPPSATDASTDDTTAAAVPTTCTNTKATGAGFADIATLSGATFGTKASSAGSKIVALDADTYTFSNFSEQQSGAFISSGGLSGINTSKTIVQMNANTSTVASKIPPQSQAPATNQYYLMRLKGNGATLNCLTVKGTNQGHLYNGIMYQQNANPVLSNAVVSNIPGSTSTPPGETFMVNFFGNTGTATISNTTIDGSNIAAAGIGTNSSSAVFNFTNLVTENLKYSAGIALWQQTGTVNVRNWTSTNSARSLGAEHLAATVNLYDPKWDTPQVGHDITLTAYPGHAAGRINFYLTKKPDRKFIVLADSSAHKSWVHVYLNGTEQTQGDYVTWQGSPSP